MHIADVAPLEQAQFEALDLAISNSKSNGNPVTTSLDQLKADGWEIEGLPADWDSIIPALEYRGAFFDFAVQTNVYPFNAQPRAWYHLQGFFHLEWSSTVEGRRRLGQFS